LSTLGPDGASLQIVIDYVLGDDHIRLTGHGIAARPPISAAILGSS
jgi:hypothetical protein